MGGGGHMGEKESVCDVTRARYNQPLPGQSVMMHRWTEASKLDIQIGGHMKWCILYGMENSIPVLTSNFLTHQPNEQCIQSHSSNLKVLHF